MIRHIVLLVVAGTAVFGQPQEIESLAPYVPTPENVAVRMLKLGGLKAGERMFDLGSGDGRMVILAAQKFRADATGVEYHDGRYKESVEKIKSLGLSRRARIIHGDILKQDYSKADLITVYLLPVGNDKVEPILERQLRKGARVVAHDFQFSGWTPVKTEKVEDAQGGLFHTLYLYKR